MKCRICSNENIVKFLSLGHTALANSYLSEKDLHKEENKFPLDLCFCPTCKVVQLMHAVPPDMLFKHYLYVSSTSNTLRTHFSRMAESLSGEFDLGRDSLVVDIGSNDGLLLKAFQKSGIKTIGIEPATNLAKIAESEGIETINDFVNYNVVNQIINLRGRADIVTANNVFAHTADIHGMLENVKMLLKDNGIFVIEVAYLVDMLEKMTFDSIYHEHIFYYSLTSLDYFFKNNGMQTCKAEHVTTHGGSLRVFIKKHESDMRVDPSVTELLEKERGIVDDIETYRNFASRVHGVKGKLRDKIMAIKNQGKKIAAYGAPAKATTLLSFCEIGSDCIDYVVDDSPLKQGLYTPGTHIPIVSPKMLDEDRPDYILILAWNLAEEILSKTKGYRDAGAKFIIPLPEPIVV